MSASEVGVGYVRLLPSMRGFSGEVRRQLGPVGREQGRGFGTRFAGGFASNIGGMVDAIGRTVMRGVETAGTAAGAVLAGSLIGGFGRLSELEVARTRLRNMGLATDDVETLMSSLLDTLLGTPFALNAGASAMTNFVSAGVGLDRVPRIMGMVTDAAGFAQADLGAVSEIFEQVALGGRLTAMELMRLQRNGVPALALLADAAGVTGGEFRDMVSDGQIDAEKFFELWEKGAKGFGENGIVLEGAAKGAGETVRGTLANLRTAISRFGARILEPFFGSIRPIAEGIGAAFGELGDRLAPVMERLGDSPGFRRFVDFFETLPRRIGPGIDRLQDLGPALGPIAGGFAAIATSGLARSLGPLGKMVPAVSPLVGVFAGLIATSPELRDAFSRLGEALQPVMAALGESLLTAVVRLAEVAIPLMVEGIEALIPWVERLGEHADVVAPALVGMAAAFVGFKFVAWTAGFLGLAKGVGALTVLANPITATAAAIGALGTALWFAINRPEQFDERFDAYRRALREFSDDASWQDLNDRLDEHLFDVGMVTTRTVLLWDRNKDQILGILGTLSRQTRTLTRAGMDAVLGITRSFRGDWAGTWEGVSKAVRGVLSALGEFIPRPIRDGLAGIHRTMGEWRDRLRTRADQVVGWVTGPFRWLPGILYRAGRDAFVGFFNGIRDFADRAVDKAREVAGGVVSAVRGVLKMESPSRVMRDLGGDAVAGFAGGIAAAAADVVAEAEAIARAASRPFEVAVTAATPAGGAIPATSGPTVGFGDIHVGDRRDADELIARLRMAVAVSG